MRKVSSASSIKIIDITENPAYEKQLYKCLAPMPFRRYANRQQYLDFAMSKGFHKKLLMVNDEVVASIEYAPAEASGYPITGKDVVIMNCVWVLRKMKGHHFGKLLVDHMVKSEAAALGFATIALEDHWSPWFRKLQIEKLGFKVLDSVAVSHRKKRIDQVFRVFLMWLPRSVDAKQPVWDRQKLLEGETFCLAHPLYRPRWWKGNILEHRTV
jgi:hypothetical protein